MGAYICRFGPSFTAETPIPVVVFGSCPGPTIESVDRVRSAGFIDLAPESLFECGFHKPINNTLVAAVAGERVFVFRMFFLAVGAVDVEIRDGTTTEMTGPMALNQTVGIWMDYSDEPWFITTAGNALVMNLSAAVQVSGRVYYKQAP